MESSSKYLEHFLCALLFYSFTVQLKIVNTIFCELPIEVKDPPGLKSLMIFFCIPNVLS